MTGIEGYEDALASELDDYLSERDKASAHHVYVTAYGDIDIDVLTRALFARHEITAAYLLMCLTVDTVVASSRRDYDYWDYENKPWLMQRLLHRLVNRWRKFFGYRDYDW